MYSNKLRDFENAEIEREKKEKSNKKNPHKTIAV